MKGIRLCTTEEKYKDIAGKCEHLSGNYYELHSMVGTFPMGSFVLNEAYKQAYKADEACCHHLDSNQMHQKAIIVLFDHYYQIVELGKVFSSVEGSLHLSNNLEQGSLKVAFRFSIPESIVMPIYNYLKVLDILTPGKSEYLGNFLFSARKTLKIYISACHVSIFSHSKRTLTVTLSNDASRDEKGLFFSILDMFLSEKKYLNHISHVFSFNQDTALFKALSHLYASSASSQDQDLEMLRLFFNDNGMIVGNVASQQFSIQ